MVSERLSPSTAKASRRASVAGSHRKFTTVIQKSYTPVAYRMLTYFTAADGFFFTPGPFFA